MSARSERGEDVEPLLRSLRDLKDRLEQIMARPKAGPRDAEDAREAAQALADLLRGEERAIRLLRSEAAPDEPGERSVPYMLTGLPLHEAARRVLEGAGWTMHVHELGTRIKARGWRHPRSRNARPDQIEYQLAARLPRHLDVFTRVAPNTFGLAKWGDSPPRAERPKPRLGIASSGEPYTGPSARWLSEHPEAWYDDMVRDDRG